MIIKIETVENGWETERRIVVRDDAKLVQALLRAVKRHREAVDGETPSVACGDSSLKEGALGAKLAGAAPPEGEPLDCAGGQYCAAASALEESAASVSPARCEASGGGYKGFLLIACGGCGKVAAYNSRLETRAFVCRECAHVTPLEGLAEVEMKCGARGKTWRYKTNCTGAEVFCGCIGCGAEMRAQWHKKLRKYVPA